LILQELEGWAKKSTLAPNWKIRDKNVTAILLYLNASYKKIDLFEPYIDVENSLCFAKKLK
jgi:hypothetical protein